MKLATGFLLVAAVLVLAACSGTTAAVPPTPPPLTVEKGEGDAPSRLTLSPRAAERLGIETVAVAEAQVDGATRTVVPYAAVIYDPTGATWAYTNPDGLVFVRAPITIERIDGDRVVLESGPPPGTLVVTVGAPEFWGAENGVGGGH
jgi:multidrug efflux pump subunit AcrA (membrane-fusion protein)